MIAASATTNPPVVRASKAASAAASATTRAAPNRRAPDAIAATYDTVMPSRKRAYAFQPPTIGLMTRAHGSHAAAAKAAKAAPRPNVLHVVMGDLLRPCGVASARARPLGRRRPPRSATTGMHSLRSRAPARSARARAGCRTGFAAPPGALRVPALPRRVARSGSATPPPRDGGE